MILSEGARNDSVIIAVGVGGGIALFWWLNSRPVERTRSEVIDLIERALVTGGDSAWDNFVSVRIVDPSLEAVRRKCSAVNLESKQTFNETLRQIHAELQMSN
jgi:hypothetical protein